MITNNPHLLNNTIVGESSLQHLGLDQGTQSWGGLPRGALGPACLPPALSSQSGHHATPTAATSSSGQTSGGSSGAAACATNQTNNTTTGGGNQGSNGGGGSTGVTAAAAAAAAVAAASAFNPFHHAAGGGIEQRRSPRLPNSTVNDSSRGELGQLNASTRESTVPITSPSGNNTGAPSLLSIATTASTPPANEPSTTTTTTTTASSHSSPVGHHQHFQGLHLLGATNSLFGSIFAPLLPQSSWLYNPLYHSQQYLLEPEWHALALRMAQQRLQRPDGHSSRLEDLRKFRAASAAATDNDESNRADDGGGGGDETADRDRDKDRDSPESSIEVDDSDEPRPKLARSSQSDESLDSPKMSPSRTDSEIALEDSSSRLRPSFENLNEPDHGTQLDQLDESSHHHHCGGLTVKIRVEGTVDLSTKTRSHHRDKENVGQDLTTSRRKEDDIVDVVMDRETMRPRKEKSPKPRQVWRPY
ncbi:hypothetical protein TKK_0005225 [Trichogramma kaykai]